MTIRLATASALASILLALAPWPADAAGDVNKMIQECEDCHGEGGASQDEEAPMIGGMSAFYLDEQMRAYRDEARPCEEMAYVSGDHAEGEKTDMCAVSKDLTNDQIAEIADYFAGKPWVPAEESYDEAKAETGKKVHDYYCKKCHTEGGSVAMDDAGILAGQYRHYLKEAFEEYESGERWQPEKMKPKMEELKPEHVDAIIEFYVRKGHEL